MNAPGDQSRCARPLLIALVAVGLLCRLAYVGFTPAFYAPDEQSHYNYVRYVADHRAFPVQFSRLGDASNEWEHCQPPLYYALLAPVWALTRGFSAEPGVIVTVLRGFSVLLWLLNLWLGTVLLRRMQIHDVTMRLLVLGMVCLLPTYTFVSSAINNDNLLATLGTAVLCLMAQRQPTWKDSILLGFLLGLALLTKQSGVVFFPAAALLTILDAARKRLAWPNALRHLALALGIGAILFLPWALRNWRLYHSVTPEFQVVELLKWPSLPYGMASAIHNLAKTFWSVSGISNDIGYPFPLLGFIALAFWVAGQQKPAVAADAASRREAESLFNAFLLALGFNLLLVLRFGYLFGMGQGRHLFPLLLPVALVLARGWRRLPVPKLALFATGFWIFYAVSFAVFSLGRFPR